MTTLTDLETAVVNRLVACLGEITEIGTVLEGPANAEIGLADIPQASILVGPMVESIPANGAGSFVVTRVYTIRVLGRTIEGDTQAQSGKGAIGYNDIRLLINPIRSYFMQHPNLQTDADIIPLNGISGQISLQDGGVVEEQGRYALNINLTISMRSRVTTLG